MNWNSEIKIGKSSISINSPTYFIADIAANHDGDFERAKQLIYLAKESGANCAKFQHFLPNKIVSQVGFDNLGGQMAHQAEWKKSVVDVYDQYHFRRDWTLPLKELCDEVEIDFMTTPYDYDAVEEVMHLVPAFKIGSGDITWIDFIRNLAKSNKPILLATGAADMLDVTRATDAVLEVNKQLILMQCNTNYTGSLGNFKSVNLSVLKSFATAYPNMVLGLSDHTPGHAAVLGAISLGARVIEKHFTDDNNREGPDHSFALNPITWREMVGASREIELSIGDGIKRIEENEKESVVVQRRALRLSKSMKAGTIISRDDLEVLRPCPADAIEPYHIDSVIGRQISKDKKKGEHLSWIELTLL